MKRITIVVNDELVDMAKLMEAVGLVHELHVETISENAPVRLNGAAIEIDTNSIAGAIMSHFKHGYVFDREEAGEWAKEAGYEPQSAGSTTSRLTREGYLRKAGRGKWQFVKQQ